MLVYLDHNILDNSLKGRINDLDHRIAEVGGHVVYSKENLIEIRRSVGYELKFLELLQQFGASYLELETTPMGRITGRYEVRRGDPIRHFQSLVETLDEFPNSNFGLDSILQKVYGGIKDKSFHEISRNSLADLVTMIDEAAALISEADELSIEQRDALRGYFTHMRQEAIATIPQMGIAFDEQADEVSAASFEKAMGIGPKQLKNIRPPDVIGQIWKMLDQAMPNNPGFNKMFGLEPVVESQLAPESVVEKVNTLYHGLNFFGYFRDKGMKNIRRVTASFSDMTHAGYASVCDLLFSGDEDFVRKAEAVYEFLNIPTRILYLPWENPPG